jgi:2-polyprenyl-6-methoxyphenol hydroxylase-like FAD-dependent oxidoreductase
MNAMDDVGDVLIVGAGPVGLLSALALAQTGARVTVIEAADDVSDAPRAAVYFPSTMLVLQQLGIFDDVAAQSVKGHSFGHHVPLLDERIQIKIGQVPGTSFDYNLHCGQDIVARVAMEHAQRLGVRVLFGHKLEAIVQEPAAAIATVTTSEGTRDFRASWIIGADGARSTVRRLMNIAFEGTTWPNRFVATNVYCDFGKLGYFEANFVCDPVYSAVIALIDKDGLWRLTYQEDASQPVESFMDRLPERYAHFIPEGTPYEIKAANPYAIHQRAAATLRQGRVLLAGDAAHATNPCGGLGLTTGIITGMVLSDVLGAVIRGEVGEEILDQYSDERRRVFWDVTSPAASQNKQILERQSLDEMRHDLIGVKMAANDPEIGKMMMLFPFRVVGDVLREDSRWANLDPTPSLGIALDRVSQLA